MLDWALTGGMESEAEEDMGREDAGAGHAHGEGTFICILSEICPSDCLVRPVEVFPPSLEVLERSFVRIYTQI